jgi:hypothetical protein
VTVAATACTSSKQPANEPPAQSDVKPIDRSAPLLPETTKVTQGRPTRLLAALPLPTDRALYVGEWPSLPASHTTICYFAFESAYPEPDVADPEQTFCEELKNPVQLWERVEYRGWPDITFGTVDSSIDEIRLMFDDPCASRTYKSRGPLLRSYPKRRVFMLDQSGSCLWESAQALRDGKTVATYEKPAAPGD